MLTSVPLRAKKALYHIVLASTLFSASIGHAALAPLDAGANGKNSGTVPYNVPNLGYNFIAANVNFTILDGTTVGSVLNGSIDNNFGNVLLICGGTGCTNDVINFAGGATLSGAVGATNGLAAMNIQGAGKTVA